MPVTKMMDRTQLREIVRQTRAVYAELDQRPISRSCSNVAQCCHFRLTGKTPHLTRGEAVTTWSALRASGRRELPPSIAGACPLLDPASQRCRIYEGRPFGCRTHFCQNAGGPYARREVLDLIRRLEEIDSANGGDGPRPLQSALQTVEDLF